MALEDITPRIGFLMFVGVVITILFIMSCTTFWKHNYQEAGLFLVSGIGLSFAFFRRRKIALAIVGFGFLLVSAGMNVIFHASLAGILLTIGSAASLYFIIVWDTKKNPRYTAKDWKMLFDNDPKS